MKWTKSINEGDKKKIHVDKEEMSRMKEGKDERDDWMNDIASEEWWL